MNRIICGIVISLGYLGILIGLGMQWAGIVTAGGAKGWQVAVGGVVAVVSGVIWYYVAKRLGKIPAK